MAEQVSGVVVNESCAPLITAHEMVSTRLRLTGRLCIFESSSYKESRNHVHVHVHRAVKHWKK